MDTLAALAFVAFPFAWILYRFASVRRAALVDIAGARDVDSVIRLHGPGTYDFGIMGSSRYRSALQKIYGRGAPGVSGKEVEAVLVLERTSPAVRVEVEGHTVGNLAPDIAAEYRRRLADAGHAKAKGACKGKVMVRHGAIDHVDFAVRLDLPARR